MALTSLFENKMLNDWRSYHYAVAHVYDITNLWEDQSFWFLYQTLQ